MSKQQEVEMEKDGERGFVLASAVPAWERNGWTVVDDGSSESGDEPVLTEVPVEQPAPGAKVVVQSDEEGEDQ